MSPNLLIYALPMSNQSFFNKITFQEQVKYKINKQKCSIAAICIFIGAMETNIW